MKPKVILHSLDATDLGADPTSSQLLGYFITNKALAKRHNLDGGGFGFPNLAFCQRFRGASLRFHLYNRTQRGQFLFKT